ncbi:hypothetical protein GCM10020221_06800 [Streptomyces thioluteus]|uniref:Uncharacterized protein n=1 Tax=Streptomyces thioluteus TaxID=66431 RepID=A0ABN3WF39_STRTU
MNDCTHQHGWTPLADGAKRCVACGVERYGAYGPLRMPENDPPDRTDRSVAAATAIATLGTRFLEARSRLLRRRPRWAVAA